VYEEIGSQISSPDDLNGHSEWEQDLQKQRVRFYDAESFNAHFRDQTEPGTIEDFAEQIFDAIEPSLVASDSALTRLTTAVGLAAVIVPASVLAPQAKTRVKQGVCHQLANRNRITWKV
jgi:hypothetical protein